MAESMWTSLLQQCPVCRMHGVVLGLRHGCLICNVMSTAPLEGPAACCSIL